MRTGTKCKKIIVNWINLPYGQRFICSIDTHTHVYMFKHYRRKQLFLRFKGCRFTNLQTCRTFVRHHHIFILLRTRSNIIKPNTIIDKVSVEIANIELGVNYLGMQLVCRFNSRKHVVIKTTIDITLITDNYTECLKDSHRRSSRESPSRQNCW